MSGKRKGEQNKEVDIQLVKEKNYLSKRPSRYEQRDGVLFHRVHFVPRPGEHKRPFRKTAPKGDRLKGVSAKVKNPSGTGGLKESRSRSLNPEEGGSNGGLARGKEVRT